MHLSRVLAAAVLFAVAALLHGPAIAQTAPNWPIKPVKVIVPYAPGGSTDNATRAFMDRLSIVLGQQFVIENKGGASGAVGTEAGVRSAPDGYTFFVVPVATITVLPAARPVPFDPFKDMVPVSRFAESFLVFATHPSVPGDTMEEFVAYAKKNPGKLAFGSSGHGTLTQMTCESVKAAGQIDMLHVPYRGGAESLTDFLAGQIQAFCEGNVLPHVKIGKARLLAVAANERHPEFPDVRMLKEIWPEADAVSWVGLFAPAGTSDAIVRKLSAELQKISANPDLQAHLYRLALKATAGTPEDLADALRKDHVRYAKMVRELGIKME